MANWRNDDNLLVKFGTAKAVSSWGGEYMTMDSGMHNVEFDINLLDAGISTTDAIVPNTETVWIPGGVIIPRVEVIVTETITGATANLDLGLIYYTAAGVLTELDYNGLLAVADFGDFGAIGDVHEYVQTGGTGSSATEVGALVGTLLATTAEKYYFSCSEDTAAFTAGALKVKVYYFHPTTIGL